MKTNLTAQIIKCHLSFVSISHWRASYLPLLSLLPTSKDRWAYSANIHKLWPKWEIMPPSTLCTANINECIVYTHGIKCSVNLTTHLCPPQPITTSFYQFPTC